MSDHLWFCKMCGRGLDAKEKPNFCYFDRVDHIENVSDEDAVKMGLNIPDDSPYEFPGDVRWDPSTGKRLMVPYDARTLQQFQRDIMERVFE